MLPSTLTVREVSSKLVTFFILSILYLLYYETALLQGLWHATFLKCSPILYLSWLVRTNSQKNTKERKFRNNVYYGLLFSSLGDGLLLWDLFLLGMISFATAHLFYINAFGFKPLKIKYCLVLYILCAIVMYFLRPGLKGVMLYGVPIYSFILVTMVWRSLAFTLKLQKNFSWMNNFIKFSAFSWMISDAILGVNKFLQPVPFSQFLIMFTYYIGQLGMALNTLHTF